VTASDLDGARILIVDDEPPNVLLLRRLLERDGYTALRTVTDSREALAVFVAFQPDLLLLDLHMPYVDGFDVLTDISHYLGSEGYVPTIVLTADASRPIRERALAMGANDFLTKPFDATEVLLRVRNTLHTRMMHVQLARRNEQLSASSADGQRQLVLARVDVLERLARTAEVRDNETYEHTQRVGNSSARIGAALGLSIAEQEVLRLAAPLHDIGKIGIRDSVLLKPGRLTPEEIEHVRTHTTLGAELLGDSPIPILQAAQAIAWTHHERWDGTGYPRGLCGTAIPLHGRIVAVADVFDALIQARPYKEAWTFERAYHEIAAQRERAFDPEIVDAFLVDAESWFAPAQLA
jgi:putative two-component system response regulator